MVDDDGYGYSRADRGPERLIDDLRTLSPAGLARVAEGWDAHVGDSGPRHEEFHRVEHEALEALEAADEAQAFNDLRNRILALTEGPQAMVDWKAEHGAIGHKAEVSAIAAALALMAEKHLPEQDYEALVEPMAAALPWLRLTPAVVTD